VILLLSLPVGLAIGFASGGRLARLEGLRLRGELLLVGLLVAQGILPLLSAAGVARTVLYWAWAATFPLMLIVCLFNLRIPGTSLAAAGLALNAAAILLNSGMPVLQDAVATAGGSALTIARADFAHTVAGARTLLVVLADILPIPGPAGVRGVASAGDVLLASGVAVAIAASAMSRPAGDVPAGSGRVSAK
jgi:hypothetical protein